MIVVTVLMNLLTVQTFIVHLDSFNAQIISVYTHHKYVMEFQIVKTVQMKKIVKM